MVQVGKVVEDGIIWGWDVFSCNGGWVMYRWVRVGVGVT